MPLKTPWTPVLTARLVDLCATGAFDADIGRDLGVSRQSVRGRRRRLRIAKGPLPTTPHPVRLTAPSVPAAPGRKPKTCQFIFNSAHPWQFCPEIVLPNRPWCQKHYDIVYLKFRPRAA
jgi:hypothetical protein